MVDIPSQSHLDGDRLGNGFYDSFDDLDCLIFIFHHCRTRTSLDDLVDRTAHIDIDEVTVRPLIQHFCRIDHRRDL